MTKLSETQMRVLKSLKIGKWYFLWQMSVTMSIATQRALIKKRFLKTRWKRINRISFLASSSAKLGYDLDRDHQQIKRIRDFK